MRRWLWSHTQLGSIYAIACGTHHTAPSGHEHAVEIFESRLLEELVPDTPACACQWHLGHRAVSDGAGHGRHPSEDSASRGSYAQDHVMLLQAAGISSEDLGAGKYVCISCYAAMRGTLRFFDILEKSADGKLKLYFAKKNSADAVCTNDEESACPACQQPPPTHPIFTSARGEAVCAAEQRDAGFWNYGGLRGEQLLFQIDQKQLSDLKQFFADFDTCTDYRLALVKNFFGAGADLTSFYSNRALFTRLLEDKRTEAGTDDSDDGSSDEAHARRKLMSQFAPDNYRLVALTDDGSWRATDSAAPSVSAESASADKDCPSSPLGSMTASVSGRSADIGSMWEDSIESLIGACDAPECTCPAKKPHSRRSCSAKHVHAAAPFASCLSNAIAEAEQVLKHSSDARAYAAANGALAREGGSGSADRVNGYVSDSMSTSYGSTVKEFPLAPVSSVGAPLGVLRAGPSIDTATYSVLRSAASSDSEDCFYSAETLVDDLNSGELSNATQCCKYAPAAPVNYSLQGQRCYNGTMNCYAGMHWSGTSESEESLADETTNPLRSSDCVCPCCRPRRRRSWASSSDSSSIFWASDSSSVERTTKAAELQKPSGAASAGSAQKAEQKSKRTDSQSKAAPQKRGRVVLQCLAGAGVVILVGCALSMLL
ncbi:hypothetical protein PAPHI01_2385 [Pancytospora philotis]|nr:hypothetical protein PAPHI01_2385 [Pancytospora philotis]